MGEVPEASTLKPPQRGDTPNRCAARLAARNGTPHEFKCRSVRALWVICSRKIRRNLRADNDYELTARINLPRVHRSCKFAKRAPPNLFMQLGQFTTDGADSLRTAHARQVDKRRGHTGSRLIDHRAALICCNGPEHLRTVNATAREESFE